MRTEQEIRETQQQLCKLLDNEEYNSFMVLGMIDGLDWVLEEGSFEKSFRRTQKGRK